MPKLLIVDDHPLYREGVVRALGGPPLHADVVGVANSAEALHCLDEDPAVELVLADLKLAHEDGLDALRRVGAAHPSVARVLISGDDTPDVRSAAQRAGLQGFLPKALPVADMLAAIRKVLDGEVIWPQATDHVAAAPAPNPFSPRQQEVLQLLAAGHSNAEMAAMLGIAERTVKAHLGVLFEALGVDSRTRALARARHLGLIR